MEISEHTIGIFYMSKLLGLAPFAVRKNSKGVLEIRRSMLFSVLTASVITILVVLTYRGLLFDANSKIPVRNLVVYIHMPIVKIHKFGHKNTASFRMKSATSKVVTALDVSVVVLATTAGAVCGLLGVKSTRELNLRLQKIDTCLHSFSNYKKDRVRAFLLILVPLVFIGLLLVFDVWTWFRFAKKMQINAENSEINVQWYIPFYTLYFILTGLHVGFANTAFGLGRRYRRLNLMLKNTFLAEKTNDTATKQNITTVKTLLLSSTAPLNASLNKLKSDTMQNEGGIKTRAMLIRLLSENHESLGKCVTIVSSSYGIAVLFILVSCLLHLVATAYFLFLEILNKKDHGYVWLQALWIIFHTFRLLLVVEPCHLATIESRKTIQMICEIERKLHDPILLEEIKKFWQQLLVVNSEFSACGLCRVNRNILTSFSSAIATYLVILIQFQKTNG